MVVLGNPPEDEANCVSYLKQLSLDDFMSE